MPIFIDPFELVVCTFLNTRTIKFAIFELTLIYSSFAGVFAILIIGDISLKLTLIIRARLRDKESIPMSFPLIELSNVIRAIFLEHSPIPMRLSTLN